MHFFMDIRISNQKDLIKLLQVLVSFWKEIHFLAIVTHFLSLNNILSLSLYLLRYTNIFLSFYFSLLLSR